MAWRNIWRNRRRTLLTIAAVGFASALLVFMLSFQFGSYDAMINASVRIHTGHLQVQAEGYHDKQRIQQVVADPGAVGNILDRIPRILAHTDRARAFCLVSSQDRTYGVMVIGIDPKREAQVTTIEKLIREGVYLDGTDTTQGLIGGFLAENLKVGVGDELTVLGQGKDGSIAATVITVKGIFRSGMADFDRSVVQIPLPYFQEVFAMDGSVHEVAVVGQSLGDIAPIAAQTTRALAGSLSGKALVVLDWQDLMPGLAQGISMDLVSGLIMYLVLIMVVAFSILNTFLMAIFERTREFGVLMAIGTTPERLVRLMLAESAVMTLIGVAAGIALGVGVTLFFQAHGIDLAGASEILEHYGISGRIYPKLSWLSTFLGPAMVLAVTFPAALYPALKIRKLKPVEAMSFN
ncbi:MAG: ABC transporter permease [Desulfobacterales bacterium]|nr:ABC transporter permease [Desulfobacterales bacterium]